MIAEAVKPDPFVIVTAGIGSGHRELHTLRDVIHAEFGEGNSKVMGSAFNFKDKPVRRRWQMLAGEAEERLDQGQPVAFVPHSLAGNETILVTQRMDLDNPEKSQLIKLRPVAPIFWGVGETLRRYARVAKDQGPLAKNSPERGIDSTLVVPVEGVNRRELIDAVRNALPERSQYRRGVNTVEGETFVDYREHLVTDQVALSEIDSRLQTALQDGATDDLLQILGERGDLLHNDLERIYQWAYAPETAADGFEPFHLRHLPLVMGHGIQLLNSMRGTRSMRAMQRWRATGLDVQFINGEYDSLGSSDEMPRFFPDLSREEAMARSTVMEGTVHASFAVQPHILVEALRKSGV